MKKILFAFTLLFSTYTLIAQDSTLSPKKQRRYEKKQRAISMARQEEEGVLAYTKQNAFGLQLRTNGYGLFYELGRMKSPRFTNLYSFELTEIKTLKEGKVTNDAGFFGNSFIFGKINNFYQAKFGFGQQYIFGQKGNRNGIAVMGIYQGGLSVGLAKPYYLTVQADNGDQIDIKYADDSTRFLTGNIYGSAGLGKGWNELKVIPGAYAKAALRFDFGRFNESIQALELGISVDAYSKKVELLAFNKPQQLFYQAHLALVFGHRK